MNGRNVAFLLVAIVCLVFAGTRISKLFSHHRPNYGLPPDMRRTWKCRADGYTTNFTSAEIDALFAAKKIQMDPQNLAIQLYECPKCGKIQMEQVVLKVEKGAAK